MVYHVVDWLYDHLDEEDFKSMDSLGRAIMDKDESGKLMGWRRWIDKLHTPSPSEQERGISARYDQSFSEKIAELNEAYEDKTIEEMEIVETEIDLDKIKIDTDYEPETQTTLQGAIVKRREELTRIDEELVKDAQEILGSATTQEEADLTSLSDRRLAANEMTNQVISQLLAELQSELLEFPEEFEEIGLEKEFADEIREQIRKGEEVDLTDAPSGRLVQKLRKELNI